MLILHSSFFTVLFHSSAQSSSLPLPMSMAGWPGALHTMRYGLVNLLCLSISPPLFLFFFDYWLLSAISIVFYWENDYVVISSYMAPLQGVVSMDGSTVASAAIQVCHFATFVVLACSERLLSNWTLPPCF